MRLKEPRVAPLRDDELSAEQGELLSRGNLARMNIFRTLVRYPELYRKWSSFGAHILARSSLAARDREILILRIGHLCGAEYEFHHHTVIGKQVGISEAEIGQIKVGPDAPGWSAFERTLLVAADELHADQFLSDSTWQALSERYDVRQLFDLIFTVGQYTMVSMALNSLGVQIERGEQGP
jgi:4-carboxymuconolactone decarboxylase